jgi:hypothetical protein
MPAEHDRHLADTLVLFLLALTGGMAAICFGMWHGTWAGQFLFWFLCVIELFVVQITGIFRPQPSRDNECADSKP